MKHKEATAEQIEATNKACKLRQDAKNDIILSAELGIAKVTLYTRLKFSNWKKSEILLINSLSKG